jgi:asparagine synthase (glutamine-hydrolysing)
MCGIAGIIDSEIPPTSKAISAMIDDISYRGPDGTGQICFLTDGVALGHRRLSIIDLSEAGNQPMASENGRFWIVFNGEIYNYLEIRKDLESLGRRFRSNSDTEVLLQSYEQWGANCLKRFMGMFAFAIWDHEKRELFAARDRIGIKPFYYLITSQRFIFASEVKSILSVKAIPHTVDISLVDSYMDFGYVPGEDTLHRGIKRLLPGNMLVWRDGKVTVSSYWDLDFTAGQENKSQEWVSKLETLLKESISLHLRSDVPLGVFLSGGIDSSAVVSMLSPGACGGLKTFSVAYNFGKNFDETCYAQEVATAFNTDHHNLWIEPAAFRDFIPKYVWHMDEPVTEAAGISLYYISKLAREHVVVCLSGEGSDELFGGYDFYTYNLFIEKFRQFFKFKLPPALTSIANRITRFSKVIKYLKFAGKSIEERYKGISSYEPQRKTRLYSKSYSEQAIKGNSRLNKFLEGLFVRSKRWDPLSKMLYFDTKTWLVDDLLIKADRMSMATSIELRVPFLDHRLVEAAASVPSHFKIRGTDTKFILKKIFEKRLPKNVLNRHKMGFPTPLEIMFRGPLFQYAHDTLLSQKALNRGYFKKESVTQLLFDHLSRKACNHREIWQLLVLEEWHRQFGY